MIRSSSLHPIHSHRPSRRTVHWPSANLPPPCTLLHYCYPIVPHLVLLLGAEPHHHSLPFCLALTGGSLLLLFLRFSELFR